MPFPQASRFVGPLQCNGAASLAAYTACPRVRIKIPHRVLLTAATPRSSPALRPSFPFTSLAGIVQRIRQPTSLTTVMSAESQKTQKRSHMGHSHGHHHHHDNTYLTSTNKNDAGVRITRIGLYVNLGMAVGKGVGGYVFNSQALTADAVHALSDLVSDFMTLATISYSVRPSTMRFPVGYGKIESLGALAVSSILLVGGLTIGLQAVVALSQQFFPQLAEMLQGLAEHAHHHGHDHTHTDFGPNINAAWLAAGSIIVKEWLYRATMKVAEEKRSSVLSSNAYHHRVDSLTAFVALFTIVASHFLESARWLDPIGGLVIAGMVVQAGATNTRTALYELADASMDEDVRESAQKAAEAALADLPAEVRGVQGIKSGQNLMFEVEVAVPADWSVSRSNDVEAHIRKTIAEKVRGTKRVTVRFTTGSQQPFIDQFINKDPDVVAEPNGTHGHDHQEHEHHEHHDRDHGQTTATRPNGSAQNRKP